MSAIIKLDRRGNKNNAGLKYRRGRVGKGVQPSPTIQQNRDMRFSNLSNHGWTLDKHTQTDGRTNVQTKPLMESRVRH